MANMTVSTGAVFIPELWANEVRAATEANLVFAKSVKTINHQGKKGDVIHIPDVSNLTANDKAAGAQVTTQAPTEGEFTVTLNKHKEVSFMIEDILRVQSAFDLRSAYTKKAGYAIAKAIDSDLAALYASAANAINGAGATYTPGTPNPAQITAAGLRTAIQLLDEADVPEDDRVLIIPPSSKNALLGIPEFTEVWKYGDKAPIQKGEFGEIYGVRVYTTTNLPNSGGVAIMMHREAMVLAKQLAPRTQAQYKQEYLATLVTVDTIYGIGAFRPDHMVAIYVA